MLFKLFIKFFFFEYMFFDFIVNSPKILVIEI